MNLTLLGTMLDMEGFFIFPGILIFIIDVLVLRSIWRNKARSEGNKILWSAIVFFLPVGGLILYWFFGDGGKRNV